MSQQFKDIFTGGLVSLFYHADTTNTDLADEAYEEIKECAGFPETGIERGTVEVKSFSSQYNRKLVGKLNVPDLTLTVNYIPGESVHEKLIKAAEDGTRIQIKVEYYVDAAKRTGIRTAFNGFISKVAMNGGDEEVVTKEFTFAVDGAPLKQQIFNTAAWTFEELPEPEPQPEHEAVVIPEVEEVTAKATAKRSRKAKD